MVAGNALLFREAERNYFASFRLVAGPPMAELLLNDRAVIAGSLELVAVENLAFAAAWRTAGHTEPPSFHGVAYDFMENDPLTEFDEAHMCNGIFAQFNPNVTCEHHTGATHIH